ncbi:hypothetical protein WICPIJ_007299 [Wickerhamomyces pijperi]|uniref:Uncharacterized protein n=1 Tax=Wickerhamomyces pijperi TaxID=599730 RepID=A0A9P8TK75_WICPI|nr:hypothetical protein WICPIJ_007299 [Wickerhamomyces pijperi]
MDGTSNILEGSSSNNKSGLQNKALARDNLILQPPEKEFVGFCWVSLVKPRPKRIEAALASALSDSISTELLDLFDSLVVLLLLRQQLLSPHIGIQHGLNSTDLRPSDFLFHVKNRHVLRDVQLSSGQGLQQRGLTNTVLTNDTVSVTIR